MTSAGIVEQFTVQAEVLKYILSVVQLSLLPPPRSGNSSLFISIIKTKQELWDGETGS